MVANPFATDQGADGQVAQAIGTNNNVYYRKVKVTNLLKVTEAVPAGD